MEPGKGLKSISPFQSFRQKENDEEEGCFLLHYTYTILPCTLPDQPEATGLITPAGQPIKARVEGHPGSRV